MHELCVLNFVATALRLPATHGLAHAGLHGCLHGAGATPFTVHHMELSMLATLLRSSLYLLLLTQSGESSRHETLINQA